MELIADMYWLCFSSLVISFAAVKVKFDLKTDISSSANPEGIKTGLFKCNIQLLPLSCSVWGLGGEEQGIAAGNS